MEAHRAKLDFFKAPMCQKLLKKLVTHYLVLTDEELLSWENSQEEFGKETSEYVAIQVIILFVCLFVFLSQGRAWGYIHVFSKSMLVCAKQASFFKCHFSALRGECSGGTGPLLPANSVARSPCDGTGGPAHECQC